MIGRDNMPHRQIILLSCGVAPGCRIIRSLIIYGLPESRQFVSSGFVSNGIVSMMDLAIKQDIAGHIRQAGLRPTRQRLALGDLLFSGPHRHVTAEILHQEARDVTEHVSLATVYNTLHQFTEAGLLREVNVTGAKSFFDTNTKEHHHFYLEKEDMLIDIDKEDMQLNGLPPLPEGTSVEQVDVIIRLKKN